jgi:hypothetical protein
MEIAALWFDPAAKTPIPLDRTVADWRVRLLEKGARAGKSQQFAKSDARTAHITF